MYASRYHAQLACPLISIVMLAIWTSLSAGQQISVIVPNYAATDEGDAAGPDDFAFTPFRVQFLYPASEFSALPANPPPLVGFYLRPDGDVTDSRELEYDDLEVRLSTTEANPSTLDIFFDDNIGPDETLVFDGSLALATAASGGVPRDFDYFYPFTQPFAYDPANGNLLMDVISFGGQTVAQIEDQDSGILGVYAGDPGAIEGDQLLPAGLVVQFVFGEDQSTAGDFDGNGQLDAADIDALTMEILNGGSNAIYDVNGDGQVNAADHQAWVVDLKNTWIGDANLDGEFNSADFVEVFVRGEYEDTVAGNSTWAEGDWNGDGDFNSGDFVAAFSDGGYENGPRTSVSAVPEPSGWILALLGTIALARPRRIGERSVTRRGLTLQTGHGLPLKTGHGPILRWIVFAHARSRGLGT